MIFLFLIICTFTATASPLELAKKYAPAVYQELGPDPASDEFTAVNFDGDWNPKNNWENSPKFPHLPVVYFHVLETAEYYFVTYGFFFPRDYSTVCFWIHCHENDFEGMRVVIKKPQTVLLLETLAHGQRSVVKDPLKIEVFIEKEGHGIYPLTTDKRKDELRVYSPTSYQLRSLEELWEKRDTPLFTQRFTYDGKSYSQKFGCQTWCLFNIGGARPPWAWKVGDGIEEGEWFLDPLKSLKFHELKN